METNNQAEQPQQGWTWEQMANHPFVQALRQANEEENRHIHGPFTFLLNANHNALRGCVVCGATWVGSMAGSEDNLRWHYVEEPEEEEE